MVSKRACVTLTSDTGEVYVIAASTDGKPGENIAAATVCQLDGDHCLGMKQVWFDCDGHYSVRLPWAERSNGWQVAAPLSIARGLSDLVCKMANGGAR